MIARVTFAFVCLASAAHAATWHVATTGNDTQAGSSAAPWRTIQRAANAVAPGDTVIIHAGTYVGFTVSTVATQSAPIKFVADGVVTINGAATANRDAVVVYRGAWITIEGLTVTGATRAGIAALECHHVTVRKNRVDQNGRWGVFSSFCDDLVVENNEVSRSASEHGVYASNSADRPVVRDNIIWGNGMCGVHMNGDINFGGDGVISGAIVERNIIRNNGALGGSGINGDGVQGAVIRNNVLDGNHASGISLYRIDGGAPSTGNVVVNNTIRMASDARWAVNIQDGSTGNTLRNNILLHPNTSRGAIHACNTCLPGLVSNYNAVVGRFMVDGTMLDLAGWRTRTGGDAASFAASDGQLFTNATAGVLTLRAGSLAIDQGTATGAPERDVVGTLRPQGAAIDIGAYEYCETTCSGGGTGPDGSDGGDGGDGEGGDGGPTGEDEPGDSGGSNDNGPSTVEPVVGGCSTSGGAGWLVALVALAWCGLRRTRAVRA